MRVADRLSASAEIKARRLHCRARLTRRGGDRVRGFVLVEGGNGANGGIDEIDLPREGVAEHAGNLQGDVDARAAEGGEADDLEAGDAAGARLPHRLGADQRQHLRDVVAAGPHVGRAPGRERDRARPLAFVLKIAERHGIGSAAAERPRRSGRDRAHIDGIEVAAGRQHVGPASGRRAGGTGRDEPAVERGEDGRDFGIAGGVEGGREVGGDPREDGMRRRP